MTLDDLENYIFKLHRWAISQGHLSHLVDLSAVHFVLCFLFGIWNYYNGGSMRATFLSILGDFPNFNITNYRNIYQFKIPITKHLRSQRDFVTYCLYKKLGPIHNLVFLCVFL